jgi:TRAP-type C4-dicarboxylate transport system permease small subunit
MGFFEKIIIRIGNWGTVVGAVFMAAIALLITATVISRAVKIALPGTFDLVETLVVVAISFALVFGQLQDRHLRAEIAIERLRGRLKAAVESFLGSLNLFFWAVMLWAGATMMADKWSSGESTDILNVPVVPFRGVWVFAALLMVILLLLKLTKNIKALIRGGEGK